jgi:hypothetical protein
VHITGASTSAPLLRAYLESLREHGIVNAEPPVKGSCLVATTLVATIIYAPFIVLGKRPSFILACDWFYVRIMIVAGAADDHELLIAQGLLSREIWITIKAACLYIDVIDNIPSIENLQVSPCHEVILRFASDYDAIVCDGALVVNV